MANEIVLYQNADGTIRLETRLENGTLWLSQQQMAELFDVQRPAVTRHLKNIFASGELDEQVVSSILEHTTSHGAMAHKTQTTQVKHYNLDVIIAVGYRVNSKRATQFRIWATNILKEYLIKGFVMDDDRLKQADRWDYFDEWLERIRDIRASEKRFYQKIRDIYATAVDYEKNSEQAQAFFQKVQNKMLWATTGKTAAELIESRSNPDEPNMGLTSWRGSIVRKQDVGIAKNYLSAAEIKNLNEIVTMYLDYAERQARQRSTVTMAQWSEKLDAFLRFNGQELLTHAGKVKAEIAKEIAGDRYEAFDNQRRISEALTADEDDLKELEQRQKRILTKREVDAIKDKT